MYININSSLGWHDLTIPKKSWPADNLTPSGSMCSFWIAIFCDAHSLWSWIDRAWNFGRFRTVRGLLCPHKKGTFIGNWKSYSYQVTVTLSVQVGWLCSIYLSHPWHKISDSSAAGHVQCIFRQLQLFLNTWPSNRPTTDFPGLLLDEDEALHNDHKNNDFVNANDLKVSDGNKLP